MFIPILLMGGIVGRLFREFAITLSVGDPDLAGDLADHHADDVRLLLKPPAARARRRSRRPAGARFAERCFDGMQNGYGRTWVVLDHPRLTMIVVIGTIFLNIYLYVEIPKGFFPQQDTGRMIGGMHADQSISFQSMRRKFRQFVDIIREDPAVADVVGFTGGPDQLAASVRDAEAASERKDSADKVMARLRPKLAQVRRRQRLPAAGAGPARRRPAVQRAVPVHAAGDSLTDSDLGAKLAEALQRTRR